MKKLFLLSVALLSTLFIWAQKVIENPHFSATTSSYVHITKVEFTDTITKIDFEVYYFPHWWIRINQADTYIQNSDGGEKLYVDRAEGIKLDENHTAPENGKIVYSLYFPAVGKDVKRIDYQERQWKIFDIDVSGQKYEPFIPEEIQGNWLSTEGSNDWKYGIYADKVICDGRVWNKVLVSREGKTYHLVLQDGALRKELSLKRKKDNLVVGESADKSELFSKTKTNAPGYNIKDDKAFVSPVFHQDTALYKGYIAGYHPKMGETGMVYVNNVIRQEQESNLVKIRPDGSFECRVPLLYPQLVFVRIMAINASVFLEPAKETFQYFDLNEYTQPFKSNSDRNRRERRSLFMGDNAILNANLEEMDTINYFNYEEAQKRILEATADEYKQYCLDILKREQEALTKFEQEHATCKKALQVKNMQIRYRAYENILSYNMSRESAYRRKNNIPRDQREIPLVSEEVTKEFLSFMDGDDLNSQLSLTVGGNYYFMLNRMFFIKSVMPANNYLFPALRDSINAWENGKLSPADQKFLNELIENAGNDEKMNELIQADTTVSFPFFKKYSEKLSEIGRNGYILTKRENIKKYFGTGDGLVTDLLMAQETCGVIRGQQKPLTEEEMEKRRRLISIPFIADYIQVQNKAMQMEIEAKLEANKTKTGYVINETPKTNGDKLFDAIIKKYKGKVILVDFWATWCSPCRDGIKKIKPLKEELNERPVAFVYITNESSPVDTWNMMVPDISGEHYRLTQDEWNIIAAKFKISGIPHYVLIGKDGGVVKDKIYFASDIGEFKKMILDNL